MFGTRETVTSQPSEWGFLDEMEPSVLLAATLTGIDLDELSGADRVTVLRAFDRMASHFDARRSYAMASLVDASEFDDFDVEDTMDAAAAEARLALRLTRRAADLQLNNALDLRDRLPTVWDAWQAGRIDARRVGVLLRGTAHLDVDEAATVVNKVIDAAPSLTTGQLGARLQRLCMEAAPDEASRRYQEAVDARRVWVESTEDGTATLHATDLPPDRAAGAQARIHRHALSLRQAGDTRSMDQLRADVLLDLLEGVEGVPQATIELRVDLTTLTKLANTPGEVAGYGPVISDIARQVAAETNGTWTYTVTDPDTGRALADGTTRRRPTTSQARTVRARHTTCVFPGCRMPATDCDLDHQVPYSQDGPTAVENLNPLCRHDHRIRHLPGWSYESQPNGDHHWTTPLGHTYTNPANAP